jgi:hypothetical protein
MEQPKPGPMSADEARRWVNRYYGDYNAYRKAQFKQHAAEAKHEATESWVRDELSKCDGDARKLFAENPELYRRWKDATAIKVGIRNK